MLRQALTAVAAIALVAGAIGHAEAAKRGKTAKQPTVTISGCAYAAPPACTNMWSGGQIYSLSGGKPPVPDDVHEAVRTLIAWHRRPSAPARASARA